MHYAANSKLLYLTKHCFLRICSRGGVALDTRSCSAEYISRLPPDPVYAVSTTIVVPEQDGLACQNAEQSCIARV